MRVALTILTCTNSIGSASDRRVQEKNDRFHTKVVFFRRRSKHRSSQPDARKRAECCANGTEPRDVQTASLRFHAPSALSIADGASACAFDARNCILDWCSFLPRWKSPPQVARMSYPQRLHHPLRIAHPRLHHPRMSYPQRVMQPPRL